MKQIHKHCVIMALNSNYGTQTEIELIKQKTGLDCKPLWGVYKGKPELSYLIPYDINNLEQWESIVALAREYKQESILQLDDDRNATLNFLNVFQRYDNLGKFSCVPREEAIKHDSYTLDRTTNSYWICVK